MKKWIDSKSMKIGLTAFLVIAASVIFTYLVFNISNIVTFLGTIIKILKPLIYGLVLAYIMHPIVHFFEEKVFNNVKKDDTKRNLSILCTIVIVVGVLTTLISIIIPQLLLSIQSLIINIPNYLKDLENYIMNWLNDNSEVKDAVLSNYDMFSGYLTNALQNGVLPVANSTIDKLSSGIFGLFSFIFNFVIGLIFSVYILANTKNFKSGLRKMLYALFDVDKVNNFISGVNHVNNVFTKFMIGKVCDSFGFVMTCTLLFLIVCKYPYALLIAVIIGITDLIPYFGPYIGTIPSALLICLVSPIKAITFVLFIVVLQQIDGNLITPKIQKTATGLPSFWVLFAITLFGGLFGVVGLILAVPCFTIIYEIFNQLIVNRLKKKSLPTEDEDYNQMIKTNSTRKVKKA